jgi:hypothetical protein
MNTEANNITNTGAIQLHGTAMGSKMAPAFAIMYMHGLEQRLLSQAPIKPIIWRRYIDDVFAVFQCTDQELETFNIWINNFHPSIKFTLESNPVGLPFLDTFVSIRNNKLVTRPHTKPTDNKQYLLPSTCHPTHVINSIPHSQALRIKHICIDYETLKKELHNLKGYFLNRNYPEIIVNTAIDKVLKSTGKPQVKMKIDMPQASTLIVKTQYTEYGNAMKMALKP